MRMIKSLMILLLMIIMLAGCASSNDSATSGSAASGAMNNSMEMEIHDQYGSNSRVTVSSTFSGSNQETARDSDAVAESPQSSSVGFNSNSLIGNEHDSAFNRKIIYTANVVMQIKDYGTSQLDIRDLVQISGGYMLNFQETSNDREKSGTLTIKIPANSFESFLDQLQKMEPITFQQQIQGQDVTEVYIDNTSRLKAKQVVEDRLLAFMEKATTSNELLEFSNELGRVQEAIEQLKGHIRYLEQNVAYSTVTIRMSERLDGKLLSLNPTFIERITDTLMASLKGISRFFQGLAVFIVGALPVLIVVLIIAIPVWIGTRKYLKNKKVEVVTKQLNSEDD